MSSEQSSLDRYKVPRESVDVEALAQQMARYMQIASEDMEYLTSDPTNGDKFIAESTVQLGAKQSISPETLVKDGEDPDTYLNTVNTEVQRLTPPKSLEDRVVRNDLATAASRVFQHYKLGLALLDHSDLQEQVERRITELMDEWRRTKPPVPLLDRFEQRTFGQAPSMAPDATGRGTSCSSPAPLDSTGNVRSLSADEISEYLKNPR